MWREEAAPSVRGPELGVGGRCLWFGQEALPQTSALALLWMCIQVLPQPPCLLSHGCDCSLRCCLGPEEALLPPLPWALPPLWKGWIGLGAAPKRDLSLVITASACQPPSLTHSLVHFPHGLGQVHGL